jgi:hypothetical protein
MQDNDAFLFLDCLTEDENTLILLKIRNYLPDDTASLPEGWDVHEMIY